MADDRIDYKAQTKPKPKCGKSLTQAMKDKKKEAHRKKMWCGGTVKKEGKKT